MVTYTLDATEIIDGFQGRATAKSGFSDTYPFNGKEITQAIVDGSGNLDGFQR